MKRIRNKLKKEKMKKACLLVGLICASALVGQATNVEAMPAVLIDNGRPDNEIYDGNIESNFGYGVEVAGASTGARISNVTITTSGDYSHWGVYILSGATLDLTNVTINTSGDTGCGLYNRDGTTNISNSSINTTGLTARGLEADAGKVTLKNVTIRTRGSHSSGLSAYSTGKINMQYGSIYTSDLSAVGAEAYNSSSITLDDVDVYSVGDALYTSSGTITATVHGQNIYGGTALLNEAGSGSIAIKAYNGSQLYGLTTVGSGTAAITLDNSTWINPGNSALTSLSLNSGNVRFVAPASSTYHALTVNNLSGSGTFYLNSNLSIGTSDMINVTNSASGSYRLIVNNQGGNAGILKVVDIGDSATNHASFTGGTDIGAYRYSIAQGSTLASAYSGLDNSDYYLYNSGHPSTPVQAAIGAGTSVHSLWYGEMNDIKKRMGELRLGVPKDNDLWARTYGAEYSVSPSGGSDYKQVVHGGEIGFDKPQGYCQGTTYTGIVVGGGQANNSFNSGASGEIDSFYVGGYKSWIKNDGTYLDIIGKYNWFNHTFTSPVLGGTTDTASFHNNGFGLSAEIGKRFEQKEGYFVEPQMELAAFWADKANYTTTNGLSVSTDRGNSLQLRVGGIAGRKTISRAGTVSQVYGKLAWVQEFAGDSTTHVNSAGFDTSLKGGQLVAGVGFAVDMPHQQLYVDLERSWGDRTSKPWGFDLGCRWKF